MVIDYCIELLVDANMHDDKDPKRECEERSLSVSPMELCMYVVHISNDVKDRDGRNLQA